MPVSVQDLVRCSSRNVAGAAFLCALLSVVVYIPVPAVGASCESLATLLLPDTAITLAQSVAAEAFTPPAGSFPGPIGHNVGQAARAFKNLPAFCQVAATLKPSKDSDIKIEVWMPTSGWNGKFLGVGNGGWAGRINYAGLVQGLRSGYATASTDTGHLGNGSDASFALGHPEKLVDLGYRSVHVMTVRAKAIVAAFYGGAPRLAYWNGCSTGGQQGLTEAQRFPDDYNGIVAGAPANYWTHLMFAAIWPAVATLKDPANYLPPSKYPLIHKAVLNACDSLDGITDGILTDPLRCHFNPKSLECKGADAPTCLTPGQVEAARKIYAGPTNPRTGKRIFPGLEPGSELGWRTEAGGPEPMGIPLSYFRYVLFKDPNWKFQTLSFDRDVALADRVDHGTLNAIDPNLGVFQTHGGKLILYHGWDDPLIAPLNTVNYYSSVVAAMGGANKTKDFIRLFMLPGMGHCGGGPGPGTFDRLGPLEQWMEHGVAPDKIVASHTANGAVDMTRPLCPYPQVARWNGTGSTTDAANFVCADVSRPK